MPSTEQKTPDAMEEAERLMTICNACRYCEGYCAMFPAMERRRFFGEADLTYLANLCHGCQGCYHACQYAPPHEFEVNVPQTFARLRVETYERFAWPGFLGAAFQRNGLILSLAIAIGLALVIGLTFGLQDPTIVFGSHAGEGSFYRVIPYQAMVWPFGLVFLYSIVAMIMGGVNYWKSTAGEIRAQVSILSVIGGVWDVLTLRNLGGGGGGCNYPDEAFSFDRRRFHHFTFYGFMLCFAATSVATIYDHVFGWIAPYAFTSLPVILGTLGGIGLLIGPAGLLWLKAQADPAPQAKDLKGMDVALLILLFAVSLTGLALMLLRETNAMGSLLAIHLGFVLALFITLPYGKMVHGVYRLLALIQNAAEARAQK